MAFYLLSETVLDSPLQIIHATLAFAIITPSLEWLIMGGGLTRSPAFFFSIIALTFAIRAFRSYKPTYVIFGGIALGLVGNCHLGVLRITLIFIVLSIPFIDVMLKQKIKILFMLIVISGIVLTPYILTILNHHGYEPFVNAFNSGDQNLLSSIGKFLLDNITYENLITPILLISLIALAQCLIRKNYWLPVWVFAAVVLSSRSMERSLVIPMCLLFGLGIETIVLPGLLSVEKNYSSEYKMAGEINTNLETRFFPNRISAILVSFLLFRSVIGGPIFLLQDNSTITPLSEEDRIAMDWIKSELNEVEGDYLLLTPPANWEVNEVLEWFPTLTEKKSINTVQGTEWLRGNGFSNQIQIYTDVNGCVTESLNCLNDAVHKYDLDYSFIYISGQIDEYGVRYDLPLREEIVHNDKFNVLYENQRVSIVELIKD
jgi:hypothetical protein